MSQDPSSKSTKLKSTDAQPFPQKPSLELTALVFFLLAGYTVLELSFNHRLLELAGDLRMNTTTAQLNDIEIWGRIVSGLGLALLLMRWLDNWVRSRVLLLVMCCALGLLSMCMCKKLWWTPSWRGPTSKT
jgi:hypothetical protein